MSRHLVPFVWLAGCGCFSYVRIDPGAPEPRRGTEVIASLGPDAGREFAVGQITIRGVTKVAGAVAYADADSLVIAARRLWSSDGDDYAGSEGLFTITRSQLSGLEQRRVSGWKSGVAAFSRRPSPEFISSSAAAPAAAASLRHRRNLNDP